MNLFIIFLLSLPGVLVATTVHEFTRAMTSIALGDELPKNHKKNTLNPITHFEPVGFILLFYTGGFGWGQPVETSSIRYNDRKKGILLVSIIPSIANLLVAIISIFIYMKMPTLNSTISAICVYIAKYNVGIAVYNLLPVSPMDCSKALSVLLPSNKYYQYLQQEKMIQMIFLFLLFFGLVDGFLDGIILGIISIIESI